MQKKTIFILALTGGLSLSNFANAGCDSNTPACGSKAAFTSEGWGSREIKNSEYEAKKLVADTNAAGVCQARYAGKLASSDFQFNVDFCSLKKQTESSKMKVDAKNPLANLDCKAMKASGKLGKDVVPDPAYYNEALKGVSQTMTRLTEFVRNAPQQKAFDQGDALDGLNLMKDWLKSTSTAYGPNVEGILGGLNACFSYDCKESSRTLGRDSTLKKVNEAIAGMQFIEKDMNDKLKILTACDPANIARNLHATNENLKNTLAKNKTIIDSLTTSVTACETSTTSTAPIDVNSMRSISPFAMFPQPKSPVVTPSEITPSSNAPSISQMGHADPSTFLTAPVMPNVVQKPDVRPSFPNLQMGTSSPKNIFVNPPKSPLVLPPAPDSGRAPAADPAPVNPPALQYQPAKAPPVMEET